MHVNHLCTLFLYSFLAVVYRGPHGRLAFFSLNVLPSENKDYYYYYYDVASTLIQCCLKVVCLLGVDPDLTKPSSEDQRCISLGAFCNTFDLH